MANDKGNINLSQIKKLEKNVQAGMKSLYTDVKFTDPGTSDTIELMRSKMNRSIDSLMSNNLSNTGFTNISTLYARSTKMQGDKSVIDGIASTFENETIMGNVMSMHSQNSHLREMDRQLEMICKYMPKLSDALDTRKEHVLSADHFSKTSINIKNASSTETDIASENKIKEMKEKYNIDEIMDRIYTEADYKGECFVYVVPYKKAIRKLLTPIDSTNKIMTEGASALTEASNFTYNFKTNILINESVVDIETPNTKGVTVVINKTGVLESAIAGLKRANDFLTETANLALNESSSKSSIQKNVNIGDEIDKSKDSFYKVDVSSDGFKSLDAKQNDSELKIPGCVVKILDRTMVKPLYIDDICLGYFYIECDKEMDLNQSQFNNTLGMLGGAGKHNNQASMDSNSNNDSVILKKIANDISNHIDSKFINANPDLAKEIYFILKYNRDIGVDGKINKIKVTFIPPEDMIHAYFNKDHKTNRGISGLAKALFPATLFSCLYISNTLSILTRGQDKRIYYIKQSVDTNIASVLLNTINQIRKSNFGLRQVENMNNIANIVGRNNDMVVPRSPSGDAPVDVEVMQGQNVEIKTDLMNMLEEMAVNSTDVPLEVIQARQQLDFATHYTMSNSKFLRKTYNRQAKFKKISDRVVTKIYNCEFENEDSLDTALPPPMYLNLVNTAQIFQSANDMATNSTEMYAGDEEPEVQALFSRYVRKHVLDSFLPTEEFDKFLNMARMKAKLKADQDQQ